MIYPELDLGFLTLVSEFSESPSTVLRLPERCCWVRTVGKQSLRHIWGSGDSNTFLISHCSGTNSANISERCMIYLIKGFVFLKSNLLGSNLHTALFKHFKVDGFWHIVYSHVATTLIKIKKLPSAEKAPSGPCTAILSSPHPVPGTTVRISVTREIIFSSVIIFYF